MHDSQQATVNGGVFGISEGMYAREGGLDIHTEVQYESTQEMGMGGRGAGTERGRFATLNAQQSLNALPTVALKYVTCCSGIFLCLFLLLLLLSLGRC